MIDVKLTYFINKEDDINAVFSNIEEFYKWPESQIEIFIKYKLLKKFSLYIIKKDKNIIYLLEDFFNAISHFIEYFTNAKNSKTNIEGFSYYFSEQNSIYITPKIIKYINNIIKLFKESESYIITESDLVDINELFSFLKTDKQIKINNIYVIKRNCNETIRFTVNVRFCEIYIDNIYNIPIRAFSNMQFLKALCFKNGVKKAINRLKLGALKQC